MEQNKRNINNELRQFTGTEKWYKHITGNLYTDGVKYLAEEYCCYWFIDAVMFSGRIIQNQEFQVWKLIRVINDEFRLLCEDGNYNNLYTQDILFSDFPGDEVMLYLIEGVLLLPSEY